MGVLTDLVVAERSQARAVGESPVPSRDFAGLEAKGLDPLKFGRLYTAISGRAVDHSYMSEPIYSRRDGGPWVFETPADLLDALAEFDNARVATVASEWAAAFEESHLDASDEFVRALLGEIVALARRAKAEGKSLLMWMSL